jgi:hypothetical protein
VSIISDFTSKTVDGATHKIPGCKNQKRPNTSYQNL